MFASAEGNAYPETVGRYVVATLLGAGLVLPPLGCSLLLDDDFSNPSATEAGQPDDSGVVKEQLDSWPDQTASQRSVTAIEEPHCVL